MTKKLFILTIALALLTPLQAAKKTKQAQAQEPFGKSSVSISPPFLESSPSTTSTSSSEVQA